MEPQNLQSPASMFHHHFNHAIAKASEFRRDFELPIFVMLSLSLQVLLILAGNVRKRKPNPFIGGSLWLAYLLADWVALYALGLARNNGDGPHKANDLQFFWVPFLLLHLGGPDTITAFSIEDNQLWLRHGLQMLFQVIIALYVYIDFLTDRKPCFELWVSGILVFIAGILKYGERIWALWLASLEGFRSSMVTAPDPGPNYARVMSEFSSKSDSGLKAEIIVHCEPNPHPSQNGTQVEDMVKNLCQAYSFFKIFKRIFVDLILSSHDREKSQHFFKDQDSETVYQVIEMELSFVYDVIYTKAAVMFTIQGFVLRLLNYYLLAATVIPIFLLKKHHQAPLVDKIVTFVLLFGAVVVELYALWRLLLSDWTIVLLQEFIESCSEDNWGRKRRLRRDLAKIAVRLLSMIRKPFRNTVNWHFTVAQHNLIDPCLQDRVKVKTKIAKCLNLLDAIEKIELEFVPREKVTPHLRRFIHEELKRRCDLVKDDFTKYSTVIDHRGTWALKNTTVSDDCSEIFIWWEKNKVNFDESILMWHIATDLCANANGGKNKVGFDESILVWVFFNIANVLSQYLLYLLVVRRSMLSSTAVIGQIRFGDTCAEAKRFFEQQLTMQSKKQACELLLEVNTGENSEMHDVKAVKGDRSKSVLWNACKLAKKLQKLGETNRWKVLSEVWVEMLCYAAINCRGIFHAERLRAGGEFLTFVWILMNHLGFGDLYQIETGHTRAKLVVYK